MFIANVHFGKYRAGDEVPFHLPNNDERLKRNLIREVKVINPTESKADKDVARKPKIKNKQAE
jgi:hypothetical protein